MYCFQKITITQFSSRVHNLCRHVQLRSSSHEFPLIEQAFSPIRQLLFYPQVKSGNIEQLGRYTAKLVFVVVHRPYLWVGRLITFLSWCLVEHLTKGANL